MLLAPNRRRTRRRTSSVRRGVSSKDYCSHIKLDGWKNSYLSTSPDLIPFEGRRRKATAELIETQILDFLHQLRGIASLGWRYSRLADYRSCFSAGVIFGPRNNWNYWNGWNHWNRLLLVVFKAMEGLDPQVKRKILSDNPRRFYGRFLVSKV